MKDNSNTIIIAMVAIVAVVGILAAFMNCSPGRGASVTETESLVGEAAFITDPMQIIEPPAIKEPIAINDPIIYNVSNCTDSDGGQNFYVKGTVKMGSTAKTDVCANSKTLREYYCMKNSILDAYYNCSYGCLNGACNKNITCTDSDGGKNYKVKGTCSSPGATAVDICLADSQNPSVIRLNEKYCGANGCTNEIYICPTGTKCINGACAQVPIYANETVKCNFVPSYNQTHICSSSKGNCTGINSCSVFVWGTKGETVTWSSDCYGSPKTVIDGVSQNVYFNCTL